MLCLCKKYVYTDSPIPTPEFVDPLRSSRVAASPAVKISETLIHEITVRFIARVIKRIPVGRAEYKTKENYNRALRRDH